MKTHCSLKSITIIYTSAIVLLMAGIIAFHSIRQITIIYAYQDQIRIESHTVEPSNVDQALNLTSSLAPISLPPKLTKTNIIIEALLWVALLALTGFAGGKSWLRSSNLALESLAQELADIRKRKVRRPASNQISADGFSALRLEMDHISHELSHLHESQHQLHVKRISQDTDQAKKELRNLTLTQDLTNELREQIEQVFSLAVKATKNNSSASSLILINKVVEGIATVDEILQLLEKDELPTRRRFSMDNLYNHALTIEQIVKTLSVGKTFPVKIKIEKGLNNQGDYVLTDTHAMIRLLSLCLEYWPQELQTQDNPWCISVGTQALANQNIELYIEFSSVHVSSDNWHSLSTRSTASSLAAHLSTEFKTPSLAGKINNLMSIYWMQSTLTLPQLNQVNIRYSHELVVGRNEADVIKGFNAKHGARKNILLIGDHEFLASVGQQFDALYINYSKLRYQDAGNDSQAIDDAIGLVLVDCISDTKQAQRVLNLLGNKHAYQNILRVSIIDEQSEENILLENDNLGDCPVRVKSSSNQTQYFADEVLTLPLAPTDVVRLIYGLNSQNTVSAMIQKFTR